MLSRHEQEQRVLDQLQSIGLEPETPLLIDDRIHPCKADGDKGKKRAGWYVLHEMTVAGGTLIVGAYGNFRTGEKAKISIRGLSLSEDDRRRAREEMERRQVQQEKERKRQAHKAAYRAQKAWEKLKERGESKYLVRKKVSGHAVRYGKSGTVVVPMRDANYAIRGLQVIYPSVQEETGRDKTYWPFGINKEGLHHLIGPEPGPDDPVILCEGYATGASLFEATGFTTYVSFDCGNLPHVAEIIRQRHSRNPLIVAGDDDYLTKRPDGTPVNPGREKAELVAQAYAGVSVLPRFNGNRGEKDTDFNDLHLAEDLSAVERQIKAVLSQPAHQDWKRLLARTERGNLIAHANNVTTILRHDARWHSTLAFNEFSVAYEKIRELPCGSVAGEWQDVDEYRVMYWLGLNYNLHVKPDSVIAAMTQIAKDASYHPVRKYLENVKWDNKNRLDHWLHNYLGADKNYYHTLAGRKWMIAAVARIFEPGCKADNMLILEGGQGRGKSTVFAILGGEFFMDTPLPIGQKDAFEMIRGRWIIEMAELDAMNRVEDTAAKSFISAPTDTYRPSYGRNAIRVKRQCVFGGTTNQNEYLKDPTGARRYWPVWTRAIDLQALRRDRDLLWAEAVALYRLREPWHVLEDEKKYFEEQQEERFAIDPWETMIGDYLEGKETQNGFKTVDIITDCLKLDAKNATPQAERRVVAIFRRLGMQKVRMPRKKDGSRDGFVWRRVADEADKCA